jgi:beta-glucosidase
MYTTMVTMSVYTSSAYNLVNGCRTSESKELLPDILRDKWGFDGMVSTDWHTHSTIVS